MCYTHFQGSLVPIDWRDLDVIMTAFGETQGRTHLYSGYLSRDWRHGRLFKRTLLFQYADISFCTLDMHKYYICVLLFVIALLFIIATLISILLFESFEKLLSFKSSQQSLSFDSLQQFRLTQNMSKATRWRNPSTIEEKFSFNNLSASN